MAPHALHFFSSLCLTCQSTHTKANFETAIVSAIEQIGREQASQVHVVSDPRYPPKDIEQLIAGPADPESARLYWTITVCQGSKNSLSREDNPAGQGRGPGRPSLVPPMPSVGGRRLLIVGSWAPPDRHRARRRIQKVIVVIIITSCDNLQLPVERSAQG